MHPILKEYIKRFTSEQPKKWDYFFTQLETSELQKLPYINQVEKFCQRVQRAIENKESICIYSDYDTDAVTATATMYWGLLGLGVSEENLSFYAPDRFVEGYGMNTDAARSLSQEYDLIITVDCGINSREEADIIKASNADLIITDHHHLVGEIPDAVAVVNPRLNSLELSIDEQNVFNIDKENLYLLPDSITGVGVAWFTLVWLGYYQKIQNFESNISTLNVLLPYVAIGTIADCQSIIEPINRLLVKTGLSILSKPFPHPGLEELTLQKGLRDKINQGYQLTSQDLGFVYSPILNSSGRITHAQLSISTLLAKTTQEARELANELIITNENRKQMVKDILSEVEAGAKKQKDNTFIWLVGDWNKGIIGLLASRLVNQYNIPVIVISDKEGHASASLRAPEGYHLPNIMNEFSELFDKAGGHPGAAGFSTDSKNLEGIKAGFTAHIKPYKKEPSLDPRKDLLPASLVNTVPHKSRIIVSREEIKNELLKEVLMIDPYGQDFPFPEFVVKLDNFSTRFMGQENNHAKLTVGNKSFTLFNLDSEVKHFLENPEEKKELWVSAKLSQNTWRGETKLEMIANNVWIV